MDPITMPDVLNPDRAELRGRENETTPDRDRQLRRSQRSSGAFQLTR